MQRAVGVGSGYWAVVRGCGLWAVGSEKWVGGKRQSLRKYAVAWIVTNGRNLSP